MFILYFDDRYFHWAPVFIESIELQEPDEKIFVWGYNLSLEQTEKLWSYSSVVDVINQGLTLDIGKMDRIEHAMICYRTRYIKHVFNHFPDEEIYIVTDVDMLMLKPLTELREAIVDYDIAVVEANFDKVCGGFLAFRQTKATRQWVKWWHSFMMDGRFFYNKDQPILTAAIRRFEKKTAKVLKLDRRYMDHLSRPNAFIWSAHKWEYGDKNERHRLYKRILNELQDKRAKENSNRIRRSYEK
jgi:hypothetical protein